jgi:hypothetical protein
VVGGAVTRDIDPKTFKIKFGGTKLAVDLAADTDISSWFTNLPRGLKAVVTEEAVVATEGQQAVTVTISGKPSRQVNENMKVKIPANITRSGIDLEVPSTEKARYDIGSYFATPDSEAHNIELRTGSNWKGVIPGWGLTGPEVYKSKDFTAVGIIQITTESKYAIGGDGEFHWTGDSISYGDLMAEARRLDAHAIIDVVIDSKDIVNETIVRRHIEADHVPSETELIKINKGWIWEEPDPNGGTIYVERISETMRTWTGTALAIRYAPAYEPSVGNGAATGYVPAAPVVPIPIAPR